MIRDISRKCELKLFLVGSEDTVTGPAWGKTSSENVHASLLLLSHFATSLILFSPRIFDAINSNFTSNSAPGTRTFIEIELHYPH